MTHTFRSATRYTTGHVAYLVLTSSQINYFHKFQFVTGLNFLHHFFNPPPFGTT